MKAKAKVFGAVINGTWTEVKAYKKENAVKRLQQIDGSIKSNGVSKTKSINSHQGVVEDLYPELN
jgi:hypothetical protein